MKKLILILVALALALGLGMASVQPASAKVGHTMIANRGKDNIQVRCDYGKNPIYTLKPGQDSQDKGKCDKRFKYDADQVKVFGDTHCAKFVGPKAKDGWYRLSAGVWRKVPDVSNFTVWPGSDKRCKGKPFWNMR